MSRAISASIRSCAPSYRRSRWAVDALAGTSTLASTIARPNTLSRMTRESAIITIASGTSRVSAGPLERRSMLRTRS
jgi:hypothetical protein